ncbi:MAG: tyrosine-type recombinase/integrase [Candidatus Lokiarchaeota archaeon]|nr:tyrosine-type recombinase/integrase [Candidatus Harpocratesius repetitus]
MLLSETIPEFLLAKEVEEGCSINTIKGYRHDLSLFVKSVGNLPITQVQRFHVRKFLGELHRRNYSKTGLARKIACLKSFFHFCEENEICQKNPMKSIKSPKIRREESLPKFLKQEEMQKILTYLSGPFHTSFDPQTRLRMTIRLMYATMARISEICNLKIQDVNIQDLTIKVRGKGNKERFIPLDHETANLLADFIQNRFIEGADSTMPLFVNSHNKPLQPRLVQKDLQRLRTQFDFLHDKKFTPHVLRHTGATHLRQNGMDLSELQDLLGHSNPNTTRIYAKNDMTRLKSAYLEFHPLENTK